MPDSTTEIRTFVGEPTIGISDGYASFRIGQPYKLRYERWEDGSIRILSAHPRAVPELEMLVSEAQFEKWFRRLPPT